MGPRWVVRLGLSCALLLLCQQVMHIIIVLCKAGWIAVCFSETNRREDGREAPTSRPVRYGFIIVVVSALGCCGSALFCFSSRYRVMWRLICFMREWA